MSHTLADPDGTLAFAFDYAARLSLPTEPIGLVPGGWRNTAYIAGGTIDGPGLRGVVRPVGADWGLLRPDGVLVMEVRTTVELDDGSLVHMSYTGLGDYGPDGFNATRQGAPPPADARLRVAIRLETAAPGHLWLNRQPFFGAGGFASDAPEVRYRVFTFT